MSDPKDGWRPGASIEMLRLRAQLLAQIRDFFRQRGVMEVETPVCSRCATTDPAIESLRTRFTGPRAADGLPLYLHTSPEFAMKRLLAAGSGPIYQICKVFRDGEAGARHNPEFTLLEWYRPGFDHHRLMDEVEALLLHLVPESHPARRLSYQALFQQYLQIDPQQASIGDLRRCAESQGLADAGRLQLADRDAWLDLLLSHYIEPRLGQGACFVYDYPASQAALARIRPGSPPLAERFELYLDGIELANGFHELTDAAQQRARFEQECEARQRSGLPEVPMDHRMLQALEHGLPRSAGVALGIDRLLMWLGGASHIGEVLAFSLDRA
ncbi:MAG: EF-P lysine aminoacylase EpmA [Sedimenticola sp.]|nr:EF-P lysine aminoacylase EpmA [Sedimenticola sp.]